MFSKDTFVTIKDKHLERHSPILFLYELRQMGPERLTCNHKVPFINVCNFVSKGLPVIFLNPNK